MGRVWALSMFLSPDSAEGRAWASGTAQTSVGQPERLPAELQVLLAAEATPPSCSQPEAAPHSAASTRTGSTGILPILQMRDLRHGRMPRAGGHTV